MGHNRAGDRRRARLRRRRREEMRIDQKDAPAEGGGLLHTVKEAVKGAVGAAGGAVKAVAGKVAGAGE